MNNVALLTAGKSKLKDKLKLNGKGCINYVIEESKKHHKLMNFIAHLIIKNIN